MLLLTAALLFAPQDPVVPCSDCKPLNEPPCSYVITQDAKGLIRDDDRVVAWLRAKHNGGAIPLRHFLAGPRVINAETKSGMREVLKDIQSGNFGRDWILENQAGKPRYQQLLEADLNHPIEKTGKELRSRMSWLKPGANTKDD